MHPTTRVLSWHLTMAQSKAGAPLLQREEAANNVTATRAHNLDPLSPPGLQPANNNNTSLKSASTKEGQGQ